MNEIIPTQFASTAHIIGYLKQFQKHVDSFKPVLDSKVSNGVIDNYIVDGIYRMNPFFIIVSIFFVYLQLL